MSGPQGRKLSSRPRFRCPRKLGLSYVGTIGGTSCPRADHPVVAKVVVVAVVAVVDAHPMAPARRAIRRAAEEATTRRESKTRIRRVSEMAPGPVLGSEEETPA